MATVEIAFADGICRLCVPSWATYYTSFSSNAWDYFLQGEYQSSNWRVQARYRLQRRQKDNNEKTALINENTHRGRISVEWNNGSWVAQAQTDLAYCLNNMKSFGYLLSTNVGYQHKDIQVYANVGYFHTQTIYATAGCTLMSVECYIHSLFLYSQERVFTVQ